jgi:hypothetical protein
MSTDMTVRLLTCGYAVASRAKVPVLGRSQSIVCYDDGTDVRVRGGMLVVCFQGMGMLRVCRAADLETEPDESCVLRGLNIGWANKGVKCNTASELIFEDGSRVAVSEEGRALAGLVGDGVLVLSNPVIQDDSLHGYC